MPCFLTGGRAPCTIPCVLKACEPRRRPRPDITRRRRGPPQPPTVPQTIPGQDQDEAGAKYLMRRVLDFLREPAAVL